MQFLFFSLRNNFFSSKGNVFFSLCEDTKKNVYISSLVRFIKTLWKK